MMHTGFSAVLPCNHIPTELQKRGNWNLSPVMWMTRERGVPRDRLWTLALKIRAKLCNDSWDFAFLSPSTSSPPPHCLILCTDPCKLLLLFSNEWHFVCLPDIFINFICVCVYFFRHDKNIFLSAALFEENLSLICCSCRGPYSQLKWTGFGSYPNEATTCWTLIGHLRGTKGHRGHLFAISCQKSVV